MKHGTNNVKFVNEVQDNLSVPSSRVKQSIGNGNWCTISLFLLMLYMVWNVPNTSEMSWILHSASDKCKCLHNKGTILCWNCTEQNVYECWKLGLFIGLNRAGVSVSGNTHPRLNHHCRATLLQDFSSLVLAGENKQKPNSRNVKIQNGNISVVSDVPIWSRFLAWKLDWIRKSVYQLS